jgi:heme-degrading monooxygenase HmoA
MPQKTSLARPDNSSSRHPPLDDQAPPDSQAGPPSWLSRFTMRTLVALACLPWLGACTVSMPYRSVERGATGSPDDKLLVSVTHATLDPDKRAPFDRHTMLVNSAMLAQPGLVAYSLRRELLGNDVWTLTIWRDEASRTNFFMSEQHQQAMASGSGAIETMRYRRMEIRRSELPFSWDRALQLLNESADRKKP